MRSCRSLRFALAAACAFGAPGLAVADLDDALYAELLERHTREVSDLARVRVDYAGLAASADWKQLVAGLAASDPERLHSKNERLAFWINAYNILAIDLVATHYPIDGIKQIGSFFRSVWNLSAGRIGGRSYSLDEIEHEIVRPMGDPRTHVALVCASLSCPPLSREPWRAAQLDEQLDVAMRNWLADPRKGSRIDRDSRTLVLSRIFDWFEPDFESAGGVTTFVANYLPDADREWLDATRRELRVEYFDYDWGLNDLAPLNATR